MSRRGALRLMVAGAAASFADACWIEPDFLSVTRKDVACRKLPPALDGLKLGVLADFHFRPDLDDGLVENVVRQVREEKLDLLALAGDFSDAGASVLPPLLRHLEKLTAAHGVFAVLGNHDGWSAGRDVTRRLFEKSGISFLVNGHSQLSIRSDSLVVAGTDFVWLGNPDPAATLKGIRQETPVIALVHEPDYFDVMVAQRDIMLQVSGHTHGGQCRVPVVGYAPVTAKYGRKYIQGEFSCGESKLFVTRGVGTTGMRVRFACPPELAVLTLRSREA